MEDAPFRVHNFLSTLLQGPPKYDIIYPIMGTPVMYSETRDRTIRTALREQLETTHSGQDYKLIEELGLTHGTVRVDMVVVNGSMHAYELKSDFDTLNRLPGQMKVYNSVFDQVTLVVGKKHLHEALKLIPDWWGLMIAKTIRNREQVELLTLRESGDNPSKNSLAISQLLWRHEALTLLEGLNAATGVRSKPRQAIYEKLAIIMDQASLCEQVRQQLATRRGWRSELQFS